MDRSILYFSAISRCVAEEVNTSYFCDGADLARGFRPALDADADADFALDPDDAVGFEPAALAGVGGVVFSLIWRTPCW